MEEILQSIASSRVAECVVDSLVAWDCRVVFGTAGDANLPFLDALSAQSHRIEFVALHHAESAALAASAYAKLTGRIGVCTAPAGPGAAQLVNGLADALSDGAPVLAVTGQIPTAKIGTHAKQYIDQSVLLNAVTRESRTLANPQATAELLVQLLRTAAGQRTAVHLAVPQDLWSRPAEGGAAPAPYLFTPAQSTGDVWEAAGERFAAASRPLIMAGLGARNAITELVALAERAGCGIVHSLGLSGLLPGEHPLNLGGLGEGGSEAAGAAMRAADLVVRLGVNWWPRRFVPADVVAIDVDARPDHVGLGLGQSYGVVADAASFARFLSLRTGGERNSWRAEVERLAAGRRERLAAERSAPGRGIHPGALIAALARHVPPEAIIALDVGEHVLWFN
ncbi:MAG TPA: thiamine pyrophosphate-binding protein, partial [Limnochordia bacterium]|nr:thiamine pyrophosphate-binding protein [Limnochordia bacterium]